MSTDPDVQSEVLQYPDALKQPAGYRFVKIYALIGLFYGLVNNLDLYPVPFVLLDGWLALLYLERGQDALPVESLKTIPFESDSLYSYPQIFLMSLK